MGTQKRLHAPGNRIFVFDFTLPYNERTPTLCGEGLQVLRIPLAVALELWFPIIGIGLWNVADLATMSVPEATMNKNYFLPRDENEVRGSREVAAVKAGKARSLRYVAR